MKFAGLVLTLFFSIYALFSTNLYAAKKYNYQLKAVEIAENIYFFEGTREDFSVKNGGNIVNTAFVITEKGVIVIDSGISRRYGEQQRAAIAKITDKPIIGVYLTHHHPDHFLGNQAYMDTKIYAFPETKKSINVEGENFRTNMYRMVGDWMRDTIIVLPTDILTEQKITIGKHVFEFLSLPGHTSSDLAIFEHTSGVLFTGDLVFHQRSPTTPHANIDQWQKSLATLKKLPFKLLIPGHGPISKDSGAIDQTSDYLNWLVNTLKSAAQNGFDMTEVMRTKIPQRFEAMALVREELMRSVTHLYPALENAYLEPVNH